MGRYRGHEGWLQVRRREIGRRVTDARNAAGYSERELAKKIGCSKPLISGLETANGSYSFRVFLEVCDALDADPGLIFAGTPVEDLDLKYKLFERTLAVLGCDAVGFLSSMTPHEHRIAFRQAKMIVEHERMQRNERKTARRKAKRKRLL